MTEALTLVVGYLLGSVDFGILVARSRGVDIHAEGSGNPGASNIARTLGRKAGALVMVGDLLKGLGAAAVGELVGGSELMGFATGGLAVLGHCFPLWHRFKGGKGVATTMGVLWWTIPWVGLGLSVVWIGVIGITRVASFGSLAAVVLAVPAVWLWAEDPWSAAIMAAISALVVGRHTDNIRRMFGEGERTLD